MGRPRDLYVYLPPGTTPARAYPLMVYFHLAYLDEHWIVASDFLVQLDGMILRGEFPPTIVAYPTARSRENHIRAPHSLFVNGVNGRFEDHILYELLPFLSVKFSIRPEREAHALTGLLGGWLRRHEPRLGGIASCSGRSPPWPRR